MQPVPATLGREPSRGSAGHLLQLLRTGAARSRADLVAATGASRSSVSSRVDQLLTAGLVREHGDGPSSGGRPPRLLAFESAAGQVLAVDLAVDRVDVALTDLAGVVLAERRRELDVAEGPTAVLAGVDLLAQEVLAEAGRTVSDVDAVGVGLPGPVEFATGRPVHPPVMPGWHDHDVPTAFARYGCPVVVDNDVNVKAAGELAEPTSARDFLVVEVGNGVGCGIVLDRTVYRGSTGSAGDIGHIHVPDAEQVLCGCGNANCLEALAGGSAMVERARRAGLAVDVVGDLSRLALAGDGAAVGLVREAGRRVGEVLAGLVGFANPERIVLTGSLALAGNALVAGVREAVYRRALPLAARSLEIAVSTLPLTSGRAGAARLAVDAHLDAERVDALVCS